jgi:hypothetical protein
MESRPKEGDIWYRIEDFRTAGPADEYGEPTYTSAPEIRLHEYVVRQVTPKGVRICWKLNNYVDGGHYRFVLLNARKRFACPTIKEALESFLARKKRQCGILQNQLQHVNDVMDMAVRKYGTR